MEVTVWVVDGSVHQKEAEGSEHGARSRRAGTVCFEKARDWREVCHCTKLTFFTVDFSFAILRSSVLRRLLLRLRKLYAIYHSPHTRRRFRSVRSGPVRNGEVRNIQAGSGCIVRKMEFVVNGGVLIQSI